MKRIYLLFFSSICCIPLVQATSTYYSQNSGNVLTTVYWNSQRTGGGASPANFTSGDIFVIQTGHIMTTGNSWTVSGGGNKIQIESGGTLTATYLVSTATFQVDDSGTYNHSFWSCSQNGLASDIPGSSARFFAGQSNIIINRWATTLAIQPNALPTITYGNITINVTGWTTSILWFQNGSLNTVMGTLTIKSLGGNSNARLYPFAKNSSDATISVGGLTVTGGYFSFVEGATATGTYTMNINGNCSLNGGTFDLGFSGTTNVNITGDLTISNSAALTTTGSVGTILFIGSGTQHFVTTASGVKQGVNVTIAAGCTLALESNTLTIATGSFKINSGGVLDAGTGKLASSGSATFTLSSGGTIKIGSSQGITSSGANGNIQITGVRTYSPSGNYIYSGTVAQVTGNGLPATLENGAVLRISNIQASVTFSQSTNLAAGTNLVIDENAHLTTGGFAQTIGGSSLISGTFSIDQNGSITGNNLTYSTSGTLRFNNSSGQYPVNSGDTFWPSGTDGPNNVMIAGAGGISFTDARNFAGIINCNAPISNTGNLTFGGTLYLNSGGSLSGSPIYTGDACLIYNSGTTLNLGNEWGAGSAVGAGVPKQIIIQNNTSLHMPNTDRYCPGSLTITSGALELNAVSGDLYIGGDLIQNGGVLTCNNRTIECNGSSVRQQISGVTNLDNLTVNNSYGVALQNNLTVNQILCLKTGNLITGETSTVSPGSSGTVSGETTGSYIVGNLTVSRALGADSGNSFGNIGVSLNSGQDDLGVVTITRISGPAGRATVNGKTSIDRKWTISSVNAPISGRTLTLAWVADDDNGKNLSTVRVYRMLEGTWDTVGTIQNASAHQVSVFTTHFSDWTVLSMENPLPVEISSFTAQPVDRNIKLTWVTVTEINSSHFIVERNRAIENKEWLELARIPAGSYSNSPRIYSWEDCNLAAGMYSYRLKMVDNDGTFSYSPIIESEIAKPASFVLSPNYPNPFNPATTITYQLADRGYVKLSIFDILGKELFIMVNAFQEAGSHSVKFNGADFASGIYLLRLKISGTNNEQLFYAERKMTLLK